jgi:hypothetical protein
MKERPEAGVTLMEILVAVSLLSLLSVGMLMALRVGLGAMDKTNNRVMSNRRVAGAERILEQQLSGFMPVFASCFGDGTGGFPKFPFFQGEPASMRFVSTYSLQEAWRGLPRILEYQVIPREDGKGVRLVVNEIPYTGPRTAGLSCISMAVDPSYGMPVPRFRPVVIGPQSFVLADRLAYCRFAFLEPAPPPLLQRWRPRWVMQRWPLAARVEMAPLESDPGTLRPMTVTAPFQVTRSPDITYVDQ